MALIVQKQIREYKPPLFPNPVKVDKTEILLLNMPLTVTNTAWTAGAILKSIASSVGRTCSTLDLNMITLHWLQYQLPQNTLQDFFWEGTVTDKGQPWLDTYVAEVINIIKQYDPKILGLSVFSDFSRSSTLLIAQAVRHYLPNIQIIVGGAGVTNGAIRTLPDMSFGQKMFLDGLIDHYIIGDAEKSFREFLNNNLTFPGINQEQWDQLTREEIASLPYPDYSDYNWTLYTERAIGITGSRGCVRKCDFCNYISTWKNFTWRTADNIFEEMLYQKQKYGISHFQFSDSLINGNMSEYRQLITLLAQYNVDHPNDTFRWSSFFILRPTESFGEDLWRLTALSGGLSLAIGLETFDDNTRFKMGKKFTNADIDFCIQMIIKYKIFVIFLLFIGYVSDTQETIDKSLQWLDSHQTVKDHFYLGFNQTMILMPGSWLDQNRSVVNIELLDPTNRQSWINTKTNSTFELREQWFAQVLDRCQKLNYHFSNESDWHKWLENTLLK